MIATDSEFGDFDIHPAMLAKMSYRAQKLECTISHNRSSLPTSRHGLVAKWQQCTVSITKDTDDVSFQGRL